jgi:hypothetical protein
MSLFSKIFGSRKLEPPTLEKQKSHIAFVLLENTALPYGDAIIASFEKYSQGNHKLSISKDTDSEASHDVEEHVLALTVDGIGSAFIALMDMPIPNGEAESNFPLSVSSFSENSELKAHHAHILVTLMPSIEADPLEAMMAYTSLLAAVTDASQSVGVYWGNAGATHTREFFLAMASEHDVNPRILLWNGISRAPESGGKMSFLSYGMNQIALPDLYLICEANAASSSLGRFFDLLAYIAARGEAIPAGDTIGSTAEEKIRIKYVKSPADESKIVWRVEF